MIYEQLNDHKTYKKLDQNIDHQINKDLHKVLLKYDHVFTKEEKKYFKSGDTTTANFYGLPKIHKSKILEKAIKGQNIRT